MVVQESQTAATHRRGHLVLRMLGLWLCMMLTLLLAFGLGVATMWFYGDKVRIAVRDVAPGLFRPVNEQAQAREERLNALVREIWPILDAEYINPEALDEQKMIYGAAAGLVSAVGDRHTAFVEPIPAAIMDQDMQGSFEGIGATVDMPEGRLTIVRLLPDSPALKAGLRPGDVILAVDDTPLEGKTLLQAISLIRGPRGTVVRLRVQREGTPEPFIVPVTRDKVELPIVESSLREDGIAYLRLTEFNAKASEKVRSALSELLRQQPKGLIFDLRGNPGGYLQMAIEVASEFLPRGTLIVSEQERGRPLKEDRVRRAGLATEIPLVVLVNRNSASASEIVAGAIRDNKRGILVGEQTYGKGSVQSTHKLQDGSSLRVTIARWLLPSGQSLDGNGLVPDIKVSLTPEDLAGGKDPQVERAAAYLLGKE